LDCEEPKATLVVQSGTHSGRIYELVTEQTLLGRLHPCEVVLPSSGVSRQHARITRRTDGYVIEDLGSLNGTFVNAERLHGQRRLDHDDQIQIHDTLLTFAAPPAVRRDPAAAGTSREGAKSGIHTSVVAALDVRMGSQSRVEVNAEIKLRSLLAIIHSAGEAHDSDQALGDVLDKVFEIFPQADHGFVLLHEPLDDQLVPRAIKHRRDSAAEVTLGPINTRIAHEAMELGQAILSADSTGSDIDDPSATVFDIQLRAIMCAPLISPASAKLGVLQLVTDDPLRQFAQPDLDVLASIGLLVGQLVEYARRYERKGAEGALRRGESRFRALVEKSRDGISILDELGRVTYATSGMSEQLGYPLAACIGQIAFEKIHSEDRPAVTGLFRELLAEPGGNRATEFRVPSADGSWRWLEGTATNLLHDPDVQGVVCNYRDITGRKEIEQQRLRLLVGEREARAEAERVSRMKDEFLATLSHELRTPLNAIVGWADLLRLGKLSPTETTQGLETIQRNARMQTQIIEDLLDMSRIVSGRIRLEVQSVDVERLALAAVEAVQPAAQAKEIRLEVGCQECQPVKGDLARLQQVLWNLLTNAIKFTPVGGLIRVTAATAGEQVELRVSDSGEGIEPEFLPHVFERFRQADSSPTRRHGGLGLGLAIVKQLVESHGGSVQAESAGLGQGATFVVRLPRAKTGVPGGTVEAGDQEEPEDIRLVNVDVLVVDDQRDSRDLAAHILSEAGAVVRACGSALEALAMIEQDPPAVLLADIAMPSMDGYELLRQVRALPQQRGGAVPAVAVTAFAHPEGRRRSYAAGFQFHLAKPLVRAELLEVVARLARVRPRN
jgi:PAS domain S-box-containing protein